MSNYSVTDSLPIGFEIDGTRYKEFTIRAAVLKDSVEAIEEVGAEASGVRLRYAVMARRVSFAGLDQEHVTSELLMGLVDRDGVALELASDAVEKKLDELSSS